MLDQSATFVIPDEKKPLPNTGRWLLAGAVLLIAALVVLVVFERQILDVFMPYLPMDQGKTLPYYFDLIRLGAFELGWTALILVLAVIARHHHRRWARVAGTLEVLMAEKRTRFITAVTFLFAVAVVVTSQFVLEGFPNSSDEYVYLFQGRTHSEGKLFIDSHPVEKSFGFNHIAIKDGIAVGRFPPGWPMILALFLVLGIPAALVNPILSVITVVVFHRLALRIYGAQIAGWSTIALAFSGFFLFNSASFFSHTSCLLLTLLFVSALYSYYDNPRAAYAFTAGFCLGLIAVTRYYTAVLIFIPVVVLVMAKYRFDSWKTLLWIGVGALPFLGLLLWYNYSITGNPLEPVTVWAYQGEGIGFVKGHTFMKGVEHVIRRMLMFAYWCSPVFLVLYFVYLARKTRKGAWLDRAEDYFFLLLIAGYFFYYEIGGNQYGPRFYFEALPFLILLVASMVLRSKRVWPRILFQVAIVLAAIKIPIIAVREHQIVKERLDVYRLVKEQNIHNAVVLLSTGTGVLRPMPSGDLTRNDSHYSNDVLYAIDHIHANGPLMEHYKDRAFYRYERPRDSATGALIRLK